MLVACGGPRPARVAQYQGIVLDARGLGAAQLGIEEERDPTIRSYVAQHGEPDYIYVPGATDVELIYYSGASRLAHFHRPEAGAPSAVGELSPLPLEVTNVLAVDIRADTPGDINAPEHALTGCWTVTVGADRCRTCCRSATFCSTQCAG